jgi:hypothetical protein
MRFATMSYTPFWLPMAVPRFPPNPFRVHQMSGLSEPRWMCSPHCPVALCWGGSNARCLPCHVSSMPAARMSDVQASAARLLKSALDWECPKASSCRCTMPKSFIMQMHHAKRTAAPSAGGDLLSCPKASACRCTMPKSFIMQMHHAKRTAAPSAGGDLLSCPTSKWSGHLVMNIPIRRHAIATHNVALLIMVP